MEATVNANDKNMRDLDIELNHGGGGCLETLESESSKCMRPAYVHI